MKVYAITKVESGPGGHGYPGASYLVLKTDGSGWGVGNPCPLYSSYRAAEMARNELDGARRYTVTELTVE